MLSLVVTLLTAIEAPPDAAPRNTLMVRGVLSPAAGVQWEHDFGGLAFVAGLDFWGGRASGVTRGRGVAELGLRFFPRGGLSGPWVGAGLNLGVQHVQFDPPNGGGGLSGLGGLGSSGLGGSLAPSTTLTIGPEVLAGWTFSFGSSFVLQVAAGPSLQFEQAVSSPIPSERPFNVGLKAFVGAGVAL